ncbi:MAG: DUF983 domain-containing protein [Chloroflexi bacterium]|nr:DUF983 domain-containing protein [Chloroflexota bacterium]
MWRLRVLALGAMPGRCPSCLRVSMFAGFYELHETCRVCGVRYQGSDGAWLGAIAVGYAIGVIFVVALGMAELLWGPIRALGLDPLWTIAIASLPVTGLGYRPAKGLWFALLYLGGFVVPDGTAEGDPP